MKKKIGLLGPICILSGVLALVGCGKKQKEIREVQGSLTVTTSSENLEKSTTEEPTTEEITTEEPTTEEPTTVDSVPPVFTGVEDKEIEIGQSISYKSGVKAVDDIDGEVEFTVDKSKVKLDQVGTYVVKYSAKDSAGNEVIAEMKLTITERPEITEELVREMTRKVMKNIINDSMSDWEKCYKLWKWCGSHILYSRTGGDRTTKYHGAYEALKYRKGDCFVYYALYSVMLDEIGVENIKVARVGGNSNHWWNLVNLGDGWYHCDSSPRTLGDSYKCFMQTDEQIAAYTADYTVRYPDHPNYFTFDPTLYPDRETKIVFENGKKVE